MTIIAFDLEAWIPYHCSFRIVFQSLLLDLNQKKESHQLFSSELFDEAIDFLRGLTFELDEK